MSFKNFELEIAPDGAGGYLSRVLASPAGEACEPFLPPFAPGQLAGLRTASAHPARNLDLDGRTGDGGLTAEEIGGLLFAATFKGRVRSCFDESRGRAEEGLRLLLRFNLERPDVAWISSLPWELLYDADQPEFLALALDPATPVVRWLEVSTAARRPRFRPPLRILLVAASPADRSPLGVEEEGKRLANEIGQKPEIQVRRLERGTVDELRKLLRREKDAFHIVHFMGHGDFDPRSGQGGLVFETEEGESELLSAKDLETVFRGKAPSLFVLNACETGRIEPGVGPDPFAGVAAKLVQRGAPAVIAMQLSIGDRAAIRFSEELYGALVQDEPVDTGVTQGRLALLRFQSDVPEWATPVLFLRTRDGRLFEPSVPERPPEPARPSGESNKGGSKFKIGEITVHGGHVVLGGDIVNPK